MKKIFPGFWVLCIASLLSCKKDTVVQKTKTELLTSSTWRIIKIEKLQNDWSWSDITLSYPLCERDNIHQFGSSGVYNLMEGNQKCDPGDPEISTGTWHLRGLTLDGTIKGVDYGYSIHKLDEDSLIVAFSLSGPASEVHKFNMVH